MTKRQNAYLAMFMVMVVAAISLMLMALAYLQGITGVN